MKYKALATIVLLLLPMMPLALANQPTPPLWYTELSIKPALNNFTGPCIVSTEFTKDVFLWSDKSLTGNGTYAYDFYVYWNNNAGFSLSDATMHIPWPSGSYFVVVEEDGTSGAFDFYHIAVTAIGNSTINPALELGATGLFNASLLTLTFHIDDEPCWPDVWSAGFYIGNAAGFNTDLDYNIPEDHDLTYAPILSTGCGVRITRLEIINARFFLYSKQPNIDPLYHGGHYFAEDAIGDSYTITIALSDITHAYGFWFILRWDPDWYDTDIQHVTILPAFAPPYELLTMEMNKAAGTLEVQLMRPCEKTTLHAAGYTPVVEVTFVTTNKPMVGIVPFAVNTTFAITNAAIYVKGCQYPFYEYPGMLFYSGDVIQAFIPKSRADITIDGVVDIEDLTALAEEYGMVHAWSDLADPVAPAPVDIFDLVYVAKRYGDP